MTTQNRFDFRIFRSLALILLVCLTFLAGCERTGRQQSPSLSNGQGPLQPRDGSSTIDPDRIEAYCKRIEQIEKDFSDKAATIQKQTESPIIRLNRLISCLDDFADAILAVPQAGVDPDLINLGDRTARHLRTFSRLMSRFENLVREKMALNAEDSLTNLDLDIVLKAMFSAPATHHSKQNEMSLRLMNKEDELQKELNRWIATNEELASESRALYSRLNAKYQRSFTSSDSSKSSQQEKVFSDEQFLGFKTQMISNQQQLGKMLLAETHPTGVFQSAAVNSVVLTEDQQGIILVIGCQWLGGITRAKYDTEFRAIIDKRKGLLELTVPKDTAAIPIGAKNKLSAEAKLREVIRTMR